MADVVLSADEHFETLREAVWVRYCARHRSSDRERFEDLYAEWWSREVERASRGAPSRAAAPAAFVAEAVHRVMVDDLRSRARGLSRDDKGSLDIVDLDAQVDTAGLSDTASAASYEALAHRILTLVRTSLSEREVRVFVWSFLYLQPSERTAEALGLSLPRVKKDRKRIAGKVGAQVWAVLSDELDLCAAYSEQSLPAIFEILTVHVEDCPTCSAALGNVRRGALAIIGPEVLLAGGATESATHVITDLVHGAVARLQNLLHRGTETLVSIPPNGRTAAAVAVAATAVAGGAATVVPDRGHDTAKDKRPRTAQVRSAAPDPKPTAVPTPVATTPPPPIIQSAPRKPARTTAASHKAGRSAPAPAPTAAPTSSAEAIQQELTFEQQAPAPPPPTSSGGGSSGSSSPSAPAPSSPPPTTEFGFERP